MGQAKEAEKRKKEEDKKKAEQAKKKAQQDKKEKEKVGPLCLMKSRVFHAKDGC